jgi:hypothetical protein
LRSAARISTRIVIGLVGFGKDDAEFVVEQNRLTATSAITPGWLPGRPGPTGVQCSAQNQLRVPRPGRCAQVARRACRGAWSGPRRSVKARLSRRESPAGTLDRCLNILSCALGVRPRFPATHRLPNPIATGMAWRSGQGGAHVTGGAPLAP